MKESNSGPAKESKLLEWRERPDPEGSSFAENPLSTLRRFVRRTSSSDAEFCELCSGAIGQGHQHLLELGKRNIICACDACALLFSSQAVPRYRRIPRDVRMLRDFVLDDQQWNSLLIPINLAYFFHNSSAGRVLAYYPSPAGATESLLDLEYWEAIAETNPVLKRMEPDVEALLANRIGTPFEYYIAPIDQCYRLVGLIRKSWRGLSGGAEVWKEIDTFFATLRRASPKNSSASGPRSSLSPNSSIEPTAAAVTDKERHA
jgi:hypothetical protein